MLWPVSDKLRDIPLPDGYVCAELQDTACIALRTQELDWLLHQAETLQHQCPTVAAAETLQAALLAKRLSPIQQLMAPLQAQAARYQHTVWLDDCRQDYVQTDLIVPLLSGLEPHLKTYSDPSRFALRLRRDSQAIQAQLYLATQAVGESVTLDYQYALEGALLVEHQAQVYAVSPDQLLRVERIPSNTSQDPLTYDGVTYQLRAWQALFTPGPTLPVEVFSEDMAVLLTHTQDAVCVDRIIGYRRRLIRPICLSPRHCPWLSGGSLLPDGRIALHIELTELLSKD
jgi:hypothetical protein